MSQQKKTNPAVAKNQENLETQEKPLPTATVPEEASLTVSEPQLATELPAVVETVAPLADMAATAAAVKPVSASKPVKKAPVAKTRKIAAPLSPEEPRPIKQPLGKPSKIKKVVKEEKPTKPKKVKLVRDSYAMPEAEYAQIGLLKKRLSNGFSLDVKKSELLRAGVAALVALNDADLQAVVGKVERIKTGRPAK